MSIENTSLMAEVNKITGQGSAPVHFKWEAVVTMTGGVDIKPLKIMGIDIERDYEGNFGDNLLIELAFGLGTYQHQILPNKSNLTITLTRTPLAEVSGAVQNDGEVASQPLRAIVLNAKSMALEGTTTYGTDQTSGDLTDITNVQFQLKDLTVEQTRMQVVGGAMKQVTTGDAIRALVTKIAQDLSVDKEHVIKGVDMVDANNTAKYPHIVIKHGTRAPDVAAYVAHHYGSPYPSGIGSYIQDGYWWIYPLYDLKRYDDAKVTMTIINVPKNKYPFIERTYRVTQNQLILLSTGEVVHRDISENLQLTEGNGLRYADAAKMFDGFVTVKDNKALALRKDNASEVLGQNRPTGLNNIQLAPAVITANPMRMLSDLSRRMGSILMVTWHNSLPSLITPGMAMRYMYEVNNQVFELKGQVLKTHTKIQPVTPGLVPSPYQSHTVITCFVDRLLDWSDQATVTS